MPGDDGRLGPERRVPRLPHRAGPYAEVLRRSGEPPHRLLGAATVQEQQGIEELVVMEAGRRPARGGQRVHDVQPLRPGVIVPAQAVHRGRGVGAAGEVPGPRPSRLLPALAELPGQGHRLVPVTRQDGHDDQPRRRQVSLLAVEGQVADPFGHIAGDPQVAYCGGALRGHADGVRDLEPGRGRHRQRRQDPGPPQGAVQRVAQLAAGQLDRGDLVQGRALRERIAGPAGQLGDRHEVHVPGAVVVPSGHLGDHAQRQPRLADPARAHGGHQAVRRERRGQLGPFGRPADERGQRRGQRQDHRGRGHHGRGRRGRGGLRRAQGRRRGRQRPAVVHAELAQQRGNVALHGPDRDEQPGRDLRVGQVLPERGQHLGLTGGHSRPGCHRTSTHIQILPELPPGRRPAEPSPATCS